ncbi:MAG: hypothetical protein IT371_12410 [Deltaproteobacteria bacterium]|nr:hypothetical protein [Deltaproteobacteria bacterium]
MLRLVRAVVVSSSLSLTLFASGCANQGRPADGGATRDGVVDGSLDGAGTCGNGRLESGESCDTKIPAGKPGACLTACDDQQACTADVHSGAGTCGASCTFTPITVCRAGDGCCPASCTATTDADCSALCGNGKVDPLERCDTGIPEGTPGACPASCDDGNTCTEDSLLNGGTCGASCSQRPVTACGGKDGCCPSGCDAANDADCSASCGNGKVEPPEKCDTGIPYPSAGACPQEAECDDQNTCTADSLLNGGTCGALCRHSPITQCKKGDGCCPSGCDATTDDDCSPTCGNGVVEAPEQCDTKLAAGKPGACPAKCDDQQACTTDTLLNGGTCGAQCSFTSISDCQAADGCCPAGCNALTDSDCSPTCGNGVVENPEKCDTKLAAPDPGACPLSCDDQQACTRDALLNGGTCGAQCSSTPITDCQNGDGCCPSGCDALSDGDCSPSCGNGVVEPPETCDTKLVAPATGACPQTCADQEACTADALLNGGTCAAQCAFTPITDCQNGDGCCPTGCHALKDSDCSPSCGNGVVEPPEVCDTKIAAPDAGACPASCKDNDACTADVLLNGGTCAAQCTNSPITECQPNDGCCPPGCNSSTDSDCS